MDRLPPEIQEYIISYVPATNFRNVARVCKLWMHLLPDFAPGRVINFETICNNVVKFGQADLLERLLHTYSSYHPSMTDNFKYARYKCIIIASAIRYKLGPFLLRNKDEVLVYLCRYVPILLSEYETLREIGYAAEDFNVKCYLDLYEVELLNKLKRHRIIDERSPDYRIAIESKCRSLWVRFNEIIPRKPVAYEKRKIEGRNQIRKK